ncbi:hypothetical protein HW532_04205 [Kaustia mangrovi]|uniref:Uncharacterized protein n=1 Tax=Kaustia mangrovi TaxID=2593653 RepID=A0A7S8HB04_9HYPH|nr:hypothetical protein [Kaustia mangrovi]QPC41984.1 hypothetical protein HW532_04205 [Kaustia mangrovi]
MAATSIERELGELNTKVERLEREVGGIQHDLRTIRDAVVSTRSGWKVLVALVSAAGAMGALAAKVLPVAGWPH